MLEHFSRDVRRGLRSHVCDRVEAHISGLDTNLLIATDRRAYYLRLISKPEEYVARVAFQYPRDDNARKWQQQALDQ